MQYTNYTYVTEPQYKNNYSRRMRLFLMHCIWHILSCFELLASQEWAVRMGRLENLPITALQKYFVRTWLFFIY